MYSLSRRNFLKLSGGAALTLAFVGGPLEWQLLQPINVDNPLAAYPKRDWEQVYCNQYSYDSSFTFVCSPNDTHACRLRAFVRNGIILRCETNYDVDRYGDLYGNKATAHWHPRGCKKGQTFHRRVYGPHRLNHALNTVPKETLVRVIKAEDGGLNGGGPWEPTKTGFTPAHENEFMLRYIAGDTVEVNG